MLYLGSLIKTKLIYVLLLCSTGLGCAPTKTETITMNASLQHKYYSRTDTQKLNIPNQEWKSILAPELYAIARLAGTERAFTGKYWDANLKGTYYCAVCGNALFKSDAKFASSCGWPSFFEPIRPNSVRYEEDHSHGMHRVEVLCDRCDSHLGHIFDDGPPPTGMRYCMNSICLDFEPER
jgi:peptide-methionine (R)-S-oxide reductase